MDKTVEKIVEVIVGSIDPKRVVLFS